MFESLKKKLFRTADELEEKVSKEAENENNLKEESKTKDSIKEKKEENENDKSYNKREDIEKSSKSIEIRNEGTENKKNKEKKTSFLNKILKRDDKKEDSKDDSDEPSKNEAIDDKRKSKNEAIDDKRKTETKIIDDTEKKNKEKKKSSSGFLSFIKEKTISEKDLEDILWELEMSLLESDVAMEVTETMIDSIKEDLVGRKIKRSNDMKEYTIDALKKAITQVLDVPGKTMTEMIEDKVKKEEPLIVMFVGINGTGKTTTIAKVAKYYMDKGYSPVMAAGDTFRAGAIEQLTHHAENLNVKIIKHQKGSDPAAIAYDAVEHAKSKGKELVLIDTAGRMQTNTNLMDEMKKIKRVVKPDLTIFVGDSLTGNDAVEQSTKFNSAIDLSGIILTKTDADSKGGSALSIGHVIGKPIFFLGMGQEYTDIVEFNPEWMVEQIFG